MTPSRLIAQEARTLARWHLALLIAGVSPVEAVSIRASIAREISTPKDLAA